MWHEADPECAAISPLFKTCVARAWDFSRPFVVAPAMNTLMWDHPLTAPQLDVLSGFGVTVIQPVAKKLVCGDVGVGAMESPAEIAKIVYSKCVT